MDKNILKFLNYETNVLIIDGKYRMEREIAPNGTEFIMQFFMDDNHEYEFYSYWYNPKKKQKSNNPKHTGGKKPYLMLMIDEIEKLREKGVKNVEELIGYVVCLGKHIEWNTGRLIHKTRSKKPLKYQDLLEIFKCGNKKLNNMLKVMKENDLLHRTEEGYFISTKYIKKGKSNTKG